ncbi:MAG: response regulator receiver (CheY-like) modulated metal dependent phosphohydrolase [Ignavibacteriae bacterium]|nr:MAG: response regulator receiver (CheY-like) modulated metal dependent phosphohydrolase [Ignavibacteriota bacterium]
MTKKASKRHKTLLLIDDENVWLDTMKTVLKEESFEIFTADSGTEALSKLKKIKPDLILSDVKMPDMNGFELYDKIKHNPKLSDIPFVFMSSLDDYDAKKVAKTLGAVDYIEKPFDVEQVKTIVLGLLQKYQNK